MTPRRTGGSSFVGRVKAIGWPNPYDFLHRPSYRRARRLARTPGPQCRDKHTIGVRPSESSGTGLLAARLVSACQLRVLFVVSAEAGERIRIVSAVLQALAKSVGQANRRDSGTSPGSLSHF